MLNKLTIRKQSNLNDFVKILYKFTDVGGEITEMGYDNYDDYPPSATGNYDDIDIKFVIYEDEIEMYSDLDIDKTYELYKLITEST